MYNLQLKTFIFVAECGSFSKAAEAAFVSPTAIMKQINALESRLDVTLFERTNRGLQLTESGKSVFQDAKYLISYSERAVEKAREIHLRENKKSIRVGTSIMTPAKFVLDMWAEIQRLAPELKIELIPFENTPENAREILKNLGKHIDVVAGIYDEWLKNDRGFQTVRLYDKKLLLAVPLTHPLADKSLIDADDLKNSGLMLIKEGWNEFVDNIRREVLLKGVKVIDFDFFNINAFNRAVAENVPIIAVDGWENVHPLLKIIPVEWEYTVPYGIMYSKEPSSQVGKFIEAVKRITSK
ncbi:MAG: LysR family transcriptional regulator [Clostridia bacterium]|nr:LysR family transcriptional regulator [Clostridia bacterium]